MNAKISHDQDIGQMIMNFDLKISNIMISATGNSLKCVTIYFHPVVVLIIS